MPRLERSDSFARRVLVIAVTTAASLGGLTCAGVAGAKALARLSPPAAPVIATVDIEDAFDKLTERTDKEAQLKTTLGEMQKKLDKLKEEVNSDKSKIEMEPDGQKKISMQQAWREKAVRAEFEAQFQAKVLDGKRGEMRQELYNRITEAVSRLAKQNGYALVLVSDQKVQIPAADGDTVARAISFKRMMYADKALDITPDVVQMMNNEYAAGPKTTPGK